MSLMDELYTKRQLFADLAQCDALQRKALEVLCEHRITGFEYNALLAPLAQARKSARMRWAENSRWFGALAKAKREWARKQFGEHDYESLKKLNFLKFVVATLLEGIEPKRPDRVIAMPEGIGPWARERTTRNRTFMPDCDFEVCTGGVWRPVLKADLPDKVRWV